MTSSFAAAATGVSTSPPTIRELAEFCYRFANEYRCLDGGLRWGPNKVNKMVVKFHTAFPRGSWHTFWAYLAWQISDTADSKIARRAAEDLQKFIDYADPTGEAAVRNVMRGA